jgi:TPR repeat protein
MPILRIATVTAVAVMLAACETTPPQRAEVAPPPSDPARAALMEANNAYRQGDDARALPLYLPLARNGHREAQTRVAAIYSRNKGVAVNHAESCNWSEAAANLQDANASNNVGQCFELGKGRGKSFPDAAIWYRRAADGGSAYGMYNLGLAYEYGRGVAQSFDVAAEWFRKALVVKLDAGDNVDAERHLKRSMNHVGAARGDPQAQFDLAIDLFNGHEPEVKDERRAMTAMREAATKGTSPEAWYLYGSWTHMGLGGSKSDLPLAAAWIKKAADTGHEPAQIRYADIQLCGIGVKKDLAAGERTLKQAIDQGSWLAMSTLSRWYQNGDCGFRKDAKLSVEWRTKADAAQLAETEKRIRK